MVLITTGGIGFIVLKELIEVFSKQKKLKNLGLHSKVVLITSFLLTAVGGIFFFYSEYLNALDKYTFWEKVSVAYFSL